MKRLLVAFFSIICPAFSFGQILNLDRTVEVDSTEHKKYAAVIGASFNTLQQTYSFVDESISYDFTRYMPKNYILVLSGKSNLTTSGSSVIQNLGYIHLRFRDNDTRHVSAEPFTQYQWNATLGLVQRYLLGCNMRIQLLNNTKADIYYGVGLMFENEEWNYAGVTDLSKLPANLDPITNNFYKTNQYVKASISINDHCDLVSAVFLQNKIDDIIRSYRLSNYTTFNIRISKKFYFAVSADISYDNNPVVPINNTIYSLASTLSVRL